MPYYDKGREKWRGAVMVNGERATKLFDTKKEAKKWEIDIKRDLENPANYEISLLGACGEYTGWCDKRDLHPETFAGKKRLLQALLDYMGNPPLSKVRAKHLVDFAYSFPTPTAKNRARKELLVFFGYCKNFLGLARNPALKIDRVPEGNRKIQPMPTEEEVAKLLAAADRWDRNMIIAYCTTGARKSELFNMTWEDVDFERGVITLYTKKSRSRENTPREIEMGEPLRKVLEDQWKTRLPESDYCFQNREMWISKDGKVARKYPTYGQKFTARRGLLPGLCKRAGIPQMGFHSLRRFFTSIMVDKYKQSLPTLQKLLGHARVSTTDRYVQLISKDTRAAIEKLDDMEIFKETTQNQETGE